MTAPAWLRDALVVVGHVGVKALRRGFGEGAHNALDSVLEDMQVAAELAGKRIRRERGNLKKKVVIDATAIDEEE
jgi:hypothetical protein